MALYSEMLTAMKGEATCFRACENMIFPCVKWCRGEDKGNEEAGRNPVKLMRRQQQITANVACDLRCFSVACILRLSSAHAHSISETKVKPTRDGERLRQEIDACMMRSRKHQTNG